ncbi:murein hydrolase activator EnvC [Acetobacter malorum]|uniref:murein hydrolase activator EnvC family protein n=1 Tax=Acetobacter malorum TaxID=178901 RepID=UPI0009EF1488|nr:peptidoglycan DD-metalloendopeptidase family protein [Acetobacter malorum]
MPFAPPSKSLPHSLPVPCGRGDQGYGARGFRLLPVGVFALLACIPPAQAATAKKNTTHSTHSAAKSTSHRAASHTSSVHSSSSGSRSSSSSARTASTRAEAEAERSVKQAQAALAATQAQRAAMDKQKAEQAAAVTASRAKNEAAQAVAVQSAAKASALSAATVSATAQLQTTEQQVSDLDSRIVDLRKEQASLRDALTEDAKALAPVLPLAERLSLYPSDTLLAAPVPQGEAVTGFLVLRGLSRGLEHQAEDMRARQEKLTALDTDLTAKLATLGQLQETQSRQRDQVRQQALKARAAQQQANAAARAAAVRLQSATQKASSLQDAVSRLDALQADAESALQKEIAAAEKAHQAARDEAARRRAQERADAARRKMAALASAAGPGLSDHPPAGGGTRPVVGSLVSTWGSATESGPATGITYRTAPGASVRTPCSGRVDFAGPFRTYGQMVILNCGQHYRFVMAGFSGLDVATGQGLSKGAPIGHMGSSGSSGTLFIQLRHGQKPVNPAPFL